MVWRLAGSLEKLREQINSRFPNRSKASDGTIGNEEHKARSSDHNAWIPDRDAEGREIGVVSALDITHDPRNGVDTYKLAEALKASGDPRIKYIISNGRIWNPSVSPNWRTYSGKNPHTMHIHVSVHSQKSLYDSRNNWEAVASFTGHANPIAPPVPNRPLLKRGATGPEVEKLRDAFVIALETEEGFGSFMEGIIKGFQAANGLDDDGKVGNYTWNKLYEKGILSNEDR
jgi:hypothetical protein